MVLCPDAFDPTVATVQAAASPGFWYLARREREGGFARGSLVANGAPRRMNPGCWPRRRQLIQVRFRGSAHERLQVRFPQRPGEPGIHPPGVGAGGARRPGEVVARDRLYR